MRPDFVEHGLRFWYTKGNASSRSPAQVLLPSPTSATAVVGGSSNGGVIVLFAVLGLDRESSFSGWFSMTGIIHHWSVNAAPSTRKGLLRWNECVIPLDTEAQVTEEFRRSGSGSASGRRDGHDFFGATRLIGESTRLEPLD